MGYIWPNLINLHQSLFSDENWITKRKTYPYDWNLLGHTFLAREGFICLRLYSIEKLYHVLINVTCVKLLFLGLPQGIPTISNL